MCVCNRMFKILLLLTRDFRFRMSVVLLPMLRGYL